MENYLFFMGKSTINGPVFHSYVSLPEGNSWDIWHVMPSHLPLAEKNNVKPGRMSQSSNRVLSEKGTTNGGWFIKIYSCIGHIIMNIYILLIIYIWIHIIFIYVYISYTHTIYVYV